MTHPSPSFSAVLRVRLADRPGSFADLARAIADAGGSLGPIDLVRVDEDSKVRDVTVLATDAVSAYDIRVPTVDLVPEAQEVIRFVSEVEARHVDPAGLERVIDAWYVDTPFGAPVDSRHRSSTPS